MVVIIILYLGIKRKCQDFLHRMILSTYYSFKFIPGILGLGPITNFGGYYFHRDYQIEIKTWTEND